MYDKMNDVVNELQERLGAEFEVKIVAVTKNNDTVRKGISVKKKNRNIAKIYYWRGEAVDDVIKVIKGSSFPNIDCEITLEKQRDRIIFALVNVNSNKIRLEYMPHRILEGLDLAIIYKMIFENDFEGTASSDITNEIMQRLGTTEEELNIIAMENTQKLYAPCIKPMIKTISKIMEEPQDIIEDIPETLFILTNNIIQFGASCILYPQLLKGFCSNKKVDGVFIIPSSIHETLLMLSDKNNVDTDYIKQMIKQVNTESLDDEEILSNNLYYYDAQSDTVSIVE